MVSNFQFRQIMHKTGKCRYIQLSYFISRNLIPIRHGSYARPKLKENVLSCWMKCSDSITSAFIFNFTEIKINAICKGASFKKHGSEISQIKNKGAPRKLHCFIKIVLKCSVIFGTSSRSFTNYWARPLIKGPEYLGLSAGRKCRNFSGLRHATLLNSFNLHRHSADMGRKTNMRF